MKELIKGTSSKFETEEPETGSFDLSFGAKTGDKLSKPSPPQQPKVYKKTYVKSSNIHLKT